jgi:hypothetical protein
VGTLAMLKAKVAADAIGSASPRQFDTQAGTV